MAQESEVVVHDGGTTLSGPDAMALYRAASLRQGLLLYAKTKMLMTRGATPTFLLAEASKVTGHKYKRGAYTEAAEDLRIWCETMKAGLPYRDERTRK